MGEYEKIRDAENLFWQQKSRDKWLKEGDKNTKFFHLTTIIRRRRNKILGLFNDAGKFISDLEGMHQIAVNFFEGLFSDDSRIFDSLTCCTSFPEVDEGDLRRIGRPVVGEEVKAALFNIGRLKAPGWDGFPAAFFQDHWNLCGPDIVETVVKAFADSMIPSGLNHTLLVLVPKINAPQHLEFFRPISLCCTAYKIISKIIVARLRPFLRRWISPNQVSFVPGRHISDNIMIGQEMFHKFRTTSGRKGFMAWKVDLSKAYDQLSWKFIFEVLEEIKIPASLTKLIRSCVTSSSFQVLINGELSAIFGGKRGIRQGDPLSPYLFVLCMEKLSHLIQQAVEEGSWKAVKATRTGPHISHLFFADDLILFAEASPEQAHVLREIMDKFCMFSGQAVSFGKSSIFCSSNVHPEMANEVSSICGSPLTDNLGNYLGMPIIHSKADKRTYAYLVNKVQTRLAGWKSKTLSMAGRLTLIQSVNAAIPTYAMQTSKLPISICDSLDKLNRNFLWGSSADRQKVHLINWSAVCRPKALGGLGVKRTKDMNQAMLAKASWRIVQQDEGLWCKIYKQKYLVHSSLTQSYRKPASCSSTWASISYGADLLRKGLKWRIGDGKGVDFWRDVWTDYGRLEEHALDASAVLNEKVCDFWNVQGWHVEKLNEVLPVAIVEHICAIPVGHADMKDKLIWGATANGVFSVKTAYLLNFTDDLLPSSPWMKLWSLNIPPKIKIFLWTMVAGKVLTNEQRAVRKFTRDPSCPHCSDTAESLLHLFRDCPKARLVWDNFNMPANMRAAFMLDWKGWLYANLLQNRCMVFNVPWSVFFSFVVWHIWKWRCKCIFDSNFNLPFDAKGIVCAYLEEWRSANVNGCKRNPGVEVLLYWHKPPPAVMKLNVDGARSSEGAIGAGGVLRNCDGVWQCGFMATLGVGEVLQAEAWALLHGLKMAANLKASKIEVETDSAVLVCLLKEKKMDVHPLGNLLQTCIDLMHCFDACSLRHIHREENDVADVLAKAGIGGHYGCQFFEEAPQIVADTLQDDMNGKGRLRLVREAVQPLWLVFAP